MKFSLTRLFIKRPTLVFVIVALMAVRRRSLDRYDRQAALSERQPADGEHQRGLLTGASVTEMRDNIVQPIEQNLAGTPDLQTFNSVVQQGQATITAIFDINSDTATDLALTQ